jgi:DNA-binding PadR family transcriptional regulator
MHEVSKGVIEDALGELVRRRLLVTRGSAPDTSIYALGEAGKALRFLEGEPPDG